MFSYIREHLLHSKCFLGSNILLARNSLRIRLSSLQYEYVSLDGKGSFLVQMLTYILLFDS